MGVHVEEPGEIGAGAALERGVDLRGVAVVPSLLGVVRRRVSKTPHIRFLRGARGARASRRGVPRAEAGDVFPVADAGRRRVFVRRVVFKIGDKIGSREEIGSNGGGGCSNRVGLVVARAGLRRAPVQQLARGVPPRGRRARDPREAAVVPVESLRHPRFHRGDRNLDQVHLRAARDSPRCAKPGEHAPVSGVPAGVFGARDVRRGVELRRHRGGFDLRGYGVLPRRKSAGGRVERSVEQHVQQRGGGAAQLASIQRERRQPRDARSAPARDAPRGERADDVRPPRVFRLRSRPSLDFLVLVREDRRKETLGGLRRRPPHLDPPARQEARADARAQTARGGRRRQRPGHRPAIEPTSAVAVYDFVRVRRLRGAAPGTAVFTAARRPPRRSLRR